MEANQYHKLYRSLSNGGADVRKAQGWDEFFEPAYYSPVYPGDIPAEIPEFTTSELGINHPMDSFSKDVPQYFVLVIDNVDEFENGEIFVDTQGFDYVRYGYGIKKPEPMEEVKQTMEGQEEEGNELYDWISDMLKYKSYDEVAKILKQTLYDALEDEELVNKVKADYEGIEDLEKTELEEYLKRQWQHRAGIIK